MKKRS